MLIATLFLRKARGSNVMFNEDGDAYKLLAVIKEMIAEGKPYYSHVLSDYVSEDYADRAAETLETMEAVNFNGKPHQFLIEALETYLDIQANIWAEENEIELMLGSDDPKSWKHHITKRRDEIKRLKTRIKFANQAITTLKTWANTGDLVYTRLASK